MGKPTRSQSFLGEYLVIFTSTFVSGCLQTPVSPLQCYATNNKPSYNIFKTLRPSLWPGSALVILGTKAYPNMPRKESDAVPKGNGPAPQQQEFGSGQPSWRMRIE